MGSTDSCRIYSKAYLHCLKNNDMSWGKCTDYLHMLNECRWRADAAVAPRTIQVAVAAPMDNSDPCHIHSKAYIDCLNSNKEPLGKCTHYLHMFNECCWRAEAVAGTQTIQPAAPAAPTGKDDPHEFHSKGYKDCLHNHDILMGKCKYHHKMNRLGADGGSTASEIHSKALKDCLHNHDILVGKCKYHCKMSRLGADWGSTSSEIHSKALKVYQQTESAAG
ncbi:hypothetical protein ACP70R_024506 [Stipagrostis hirtigluma subsp. patula]